MYSHCLSDRSRDKLPAITFTALALLLTMLFANASLATPDPGELSDFKTAVRAKYDMKERAFANNDPEPILTRFYSEDVISTGPDGTTHVGRGELRPVYEEVIFSNVEIEPYHSFVRGDAGWDWVNFHVTPPEEAGMAPFTFKMLFLWERIDGEWWSHGEMYVNGAFNTEQADH